MKETTLNRKNRRKQMIWLNNNELNLIESALYALHVRELGHDDVKSGECLKLMKKVKPI